MSNGLNESDSASGGEETAHAALARRNLLRLGGMAAAGAAAAAVVAATDASPAGADTGTMVYGTSMDAGGAKTQLTIGNEISPALELSNTSEGPALQALGGSGTAVEAWAGLSQASSASALHVRHFDSGSGVNIQTEAGTGLVVSSSGIGIEVTSKFGTTGDAIHASAVTGSGLIASTKTGPAPAIQAIGAEGKGTALDVHGRATFSRSGLLPIPAGAKSAITLAVAGGLTATSHVLATIQTHTTETVAIRAAVPSTASGKITIYLTNEAPAGGLKVAWLVIG